MDINHFKSLSKKWSFKLREDALDIEQEMIVFYLSRQSQGMSLDIFVPGHEGALFELLKHKIRGNNLESLGGSGRRLAGTEADDDADQIELVDGIESPDEQADKLEQRLQFEHMFGSELDQLDELNNLAGSDLGETFGFTGANGRAVLSQLKKDIISRAQKRFNANSRAVKSSYRVKAQPQTVTA